MVFATTNWELVETLSTGSDHKSDAALAEIAERTWQPVYAFLRGQGYSMTEADDLTQGFFCYLIEKELMNRADRSKGKFRSFIIGALKKFCSDKRDYERAQKRSPKERLINIEAVEGIENTLASDLGDDPHKLFLRTWAYNLLERVLNVLEEKSARLGKPHFYDLIHRVYFESSSQKVSYKELAEHHGMSLDQIGNALRAAKQLYRSVLREEVLKTVEKQQDIDDEIREIMIILQEKK